MKRLICIVVSIMLMVSFAPAIAEEFTIHSGVQFGMTRDEVIAKEEDNGFNLYAFYDDYERDRIYPQFIGFMAGFENTEITYYFDDYDYDTVQDDAALYKARYYFKFQNKDEKKN